MGDEKSKENLACLFAVAFQDLSKKFKLIEEDYPKVNVFVELDKSCRNLEEISRFENGEGSQRENKKKT